MTLLSSPSQSARCLVADASVAINFNATGRAHEIINALSGQVVVTSNALAELERGSHRGHDDASSVRELIRLKAIRLVTLDANDCRDVYTSLISGGANETLDDGEAATLAYAEQVDGVALIDERKARRIASSRFPTLVLRSTVEILLDPVVEAALGGEGQIEAIVLGLTKARMHVPAAYAAKIIDLIGLERASSCTCLTRHLRCSYPVRLADAAR